jgi:hypothetical protein
MLYLKKVIKKVEKNRKVHKKEKKAEDLQVNNNKKETMTIRIIKAQNFWSKIT